MERKSPMFADPFLTFPLVRGRNSCTEQDCCFSGHNLWRKVGINAVAPAPYQGASWGGVSQDEDFRPKVQRLYKQPLRLLCKDV
jgi:hypothetical protein